MPKMLAGVADGHVDQLGDVVNTNHCSLVVGQRRHEHGQHAAATANVQAAAAGLAMLLQLLETVRVLEWIAKKTKVSQVGTVLALYALTMCGADMVAS